METFLSGVKTAAIFIWENLVWINLIFAIIIVFFQRRDPKSVWAWLLVLYFVPILGFIFYLLVGSDMHKRKIFVTKGIEDRINRAIRQQEYMLKHADVELIAPKLSGFADQVMFNLETQGSVLSDDNDIDIFTDGRTKFDRLIEDIKAAKKSIHIEYYIIKKDELFLSILEELKKKAAEGVEVRILFDAMGCRSVKHKFWRELNSYGIKTAEFFPAILRRINIRVNYRNHRKIVVIDNKIGYVGGFNIGKEYIDKDEKFGHWRDTHLRIVGSAVTGLQLRFILDWNYAAHENLFETDKYFENVESGVRDYSEVQIIASGPDSLEQNIKNNYVRLINKAKKSIYIQTPYFIPDESLLTALFIAIKSGVEVNIMIPCKPDHPFVYWATYSYVGDLVMAGAKCYTYDAGFLHAKGMIVDDKAFCYGTANMDIRSFALNFEVNAIVYDEEKAVEMRQYFEKDVENSTLITSEHYAARSLPFRMREQICRLFSPLL
jgi:cardiolipin synthase